MGRGYASARFDNGEEEILELTLTVRPAPGYLRIEVFMRQHLTKFDAFLADIVAAFGEFSSRERPMTAVQKLQQNLWKP